MTKQEFKDSWSVSYDSGEPTVIRLTDCNGKTQYIDIYKMIRSKMRKAFEKARNEAEVFYLHPHNKSYEHAWKYLINLLDFETMEFTKENNPAQEKEK